MKALCNGVGTQGRGVTALAMIPACVATDRNGSGMQGDARSYFRPAGVHRRGVLVSMNTVGLCVIHHLSISGAPSATHDITTTAVTRKQFPHHGCYPKIFCGDGRRGDCCLSRPVRRILSASPSLPFH